MLTPRWIFLNRRKWVPAIGITGGLIILFILFKIFFSGVSQADSEKNLETALNNTFASKSFRFMVESKLVGENEFYSKVEGERVMPDKVHIKGTVLKTPVEFTQTDDNTYMKDPFSGKWLSLKGNQLSKSELFITELNPLANFNFKDIPEIQLVGEERLDGEECLVYELKPNIVNIFLEEQFDQFFYTLWVDKEEPVIRQARIMADRAEGDSGGLEILIKFWDFNKNLDIAVPGDTLN